MVRGTANDGTRSRSAQTLDAADRRIIDMLTADGRVSNRTIAADVKLTEEVVAARIRGLQNRHILGVTSVFDWEAAGYEWQLWVAIECDGPAIDSVAEALGRLACVQSLYVVFGQVDLILHVLFPDRRGAVQFLTGVLPRLKGIRTVNTAVSLETLKCAVSFARVPIKPAKLEFPRPVIPLDRLDESIIEALVANGRNSNREIARQLGVSDGTVRARIRRLEAANLLRICAQTDPYMTGAVAAWAFVMISIHGADARKVASKLAGLTEVLITVLVSGSHDVLLLVVSSSRAGLVELLRERIRVVAGVRATQTWQIVASPKLEWHWARLL